MSCSTYHPFATTRSWNLAVCGRGMWNWQSRSRYRDDAATQRLPGVEIRQKRSWAAQNAAIEAPEALGWGFGVPIPAKQMASLDQAFPPRTQAVNQIRLKFLIYSDPIADHSLGIDIITVSIPVVLAPARMQRG